MGNNITNHDSPYKGEIALFWYLTVDKDKTT